MRWKSTLVLLILAIGIGTYVALYELKTPTREEQEALAKQVVRLAAEEVTNLLVEFPEVKVSLGRTNGSWYLKGPLTARAEELVVQRILDELNLLEAERVLEGSNDKPLALAEFGLEPPRGRLGVIAGERAITLAFGDETVVGENRYLKPADSPKVFVVAPWLFDTLNQPLDAYRSHELLVFETWKVERITVASPRASYTLLNESNPAAGGAGRWRLTEPVTDDADSVSVSGTLSTLRNLRIERFVNDAPQVEQLPDWGFETPYAHITMTGEAQSLEVFIGNPTMDNPDQRYAKRIDEPTIYAVSTPSVDELLQDPQTLRSRTVLDFFASHVTKLRLRWQDHAWTLEQTSGKWTLGGGNTDVDSSKVEEFLWKISDTKLTRFVEDAPPDLARYGLDPPQGEIRVWVTDQEESQQLLIGDVLDQGQTRYGRIVGRAGVVELPETINDLLATTPNSFTAQPENDVTSNR